MSTLSAPCRQPSQRSGRDFTKEQYRHCKPMLVLGREGGALLQMAGIPGTRRTARSIRVC